MPLITIAQADAHLRLSLETGGSPEGFTDPRVPDLELKITQAEAIIFDYLKTPATALDSSPPTWTEAQVTVIQAAALLLLSALYDDELNRTVADYMKAGGTVPLLLARLRDPALA